MQQLTKAKSVLTQGSEEAKRKMSAPSHETGRVFNAFPPLVDEKNWQELSSLVTELYALIATKIGKETGDLQQEGDYFQKLSEMEDMSKAPEMQKAREIVEKIAKIGVASLVDPKTGGCKKEVIEMLGIKSTISPAELLSSYMDNVMGPLGDAGSVLRSKEHQVAKRAVKKILTFAYEGTKHGSGIPELFCREQVRQYLNENDNLFVRQQTPETIKKLVIEDLETSEKKEESDARLQFWFELATKLGKEGLEFQANAIREGMGHYNEVQKRNDSCRLRVELKEVKDIPAIIDNDLKELKEDELNTRLKFWQKLDSELSANKQYDKAAAIQAKLKQLNEPKKQTLSNSTLKVRKMIPQEEVKVSLTPEFTVEQMTTARKVIDQAIVNGKEKLADAKYQGLKCRILDDLPPLMDQQKFKEFSDLFDQIGKVIPQGNSGKFDFQEYSTRLIEMKADDKVKLPEYKQAQQLIDKAIEFGCESLINPVTGKVKKEVAELFDAKPEQIDTRAILNSFLANIVGSVGRDAALKGEVGLASMKLVTEMMGSMTLDTAESQAKAQKYYDKKLTDFLDKHKEQNITVLKQDFDQWLKQSNRTPADIIARVKADVEQTQGSDIGFARKVDAWNKVRNVYSVGVGKETEPIARAIADGLRAAAGAHRLTVTRTPSPDSKAGIAKTSGATAGDRSQTPSPNPEGQDKSGKRTPSPFRRDT